MNKFIDSISFYQGEARVVDAEIGSVDPDETIIVSSATWKLTDRGSGETVVSGNCEIDGKRISVFFGSEVTGVFVLEVTATVGRETIKQRVNVTFL